MLLQTDNLDDWFAAAGRRESDLRQMDATITAHTPDLPREFGNWIGGYGLGYGTIAYRTKAAKEPTELPLLALAIQKRHLALYACVVVEGQYLAERYQSRLGKVSCGKSCIRFTRYANVDEPGLIEMLAEVNERYARGEHLFGH